MQGVSWALVKAHGSSLGLWVPRRRGDRQEPAADNAGHSGIVTRISRKSAVAFILGI